MILVCVRRVTHFIFPVLKNRFYLLNRFQHNLIFSEHYIRIIPKVFLVFGCIALNSGYSVLNCSFHLLYVYLQYLFFREEIFPIILDVFSKFVCFVLKAKTRLQTLLQPILKETLSLSFYNHEVNPLVGNLNPLEGRIRFKRRNGGAKHLTGQFLYFIQAPRFDLSSIPIRDCLLIGEHQGKTPLLINERVLGLCFRRFLPADRNSFSAAKLYKLWTEVVLGAVKLPRRRSKIFIGDQFTLTLGEFCETLPAHWYRFHWPSVDSGGGREAENVYFIVHMPQHQSCPPGVGQGHVHTFCGARFHSVFQPAWSTNAHLFGQCTFLCGGLRPDETNFCI